MIRRAPRPPIRLAVALLAGLLVTGTLGLLAVPAGSQASSLALWLDGARTTTLMSGWVMLVTALIAVFMGALGGLGSPLIDGAVSRTTEITMALPSVVVFVILRALGVGDMLALGVVVATIRGLSIAKGTRADVHALLAEDFVLAARAAGASRLRLFRRHILPHVKEGILADAALSAASVVALDAAVSFAGLGEPTSGWGALLAEAARSRLPGLGLAPALGTAAATGALLIVAAHFGAGRRQGQSFV